MKFQIRKNDKSNREEQKKEKMLKGTSSKLVLRNEDIEEYEEARSHWQEIGTKKENTTSSRTAVDQGQEEAREKRKLVQTRLGLN